MEIKTNGIMMPSGDEHVFIPPSPTETERGGIKARTKTTESLEIVVDPTTGKAYAPNPPIDTSLSQGRVAADAKTVGDELTSVKENISEKASAIVSAASGENIKIIDSASEKLIGLKVLGNHTVISGANLLDHDDILQTNGWNVIDITNIVKKKTLIIT